MDDLDAIAEELFTDSADEDADEDAAVGRFRAALTALLLSHPIAVNLTPPAPSPPSAIAAPAPPRPPMPRRPPDMRSSQTAASESDRHARARSQRGGASQRFADYAASLDDDAMAEAMAGAVVPSVVGAHPLLTPLAPALVRATAAATQELRRASRTRPALRVLPEVVRRTASSVVRQQRAGGTTTPPQAIDLFRRHLESVLRRGGASPERGASIG